MRRAGLQLFLSSGTPSVFNRTGCYRPKFHGGSKQGGKMDLIGWNNGVGRIPCPTEMVHEMHPTIFCY